MGEGLLLVVSGRRSLRINLVWRFWGLVDILYLLFIRMDGEIWNLDGS